MPERVYARKGLCPKGHLRRTMLRSAALRAAAAGAGATAGARAPLMLRLPPRAVVRAAVGGWGGGGVGHLVGGGGGARALHVSAARCAPGDTGAGGGGGWGSWFGFGGGNAGGAEAGAGPAVGAEPTANVESVYRSDGEEGSAAGASSSSSSLSFDDGSSISLTPQQARDDPDFVGMTPPPTATEGVVADGGLTGGALADAIGPGGSAEEVAEAVRVAAENLPDPLNVWWPPHTVIYCLDMMHSMSGMPWWVCIIAATAGIRLAVLPLTIKASIVSSKISAIQPEMEKLRAKLVALSKSGASTEKRRRVQDNMRALYSRHGVSPLSPFVGFLQVPIFISFFFGLRKLSEYCPDVSTGGTLWFTDLAASDPTYVLPVAVAATTFLVSEFGSEAPNMRKGWMKNFMRGFALLLIPIGATLPTSVIIYWTSSNLFMLAQSAVLRNKELRRTLGMPAPPKTQVGSPMESITKMRDNLRKEKEKRDNVTDNILKGSRNASADGNIQMVNPDDDINLSTQKPQSKSRGLVNPGPKPKGKSRKKSR